MTANNISIYSQFESNLDENQFINKDGQYIPISDNKESLQFNSIFAHNVNEYINYFCVNESINVFRKFDFSQITQCSTDTSRQISDFVQIFMQAILENRQQFADGIQLPSLIWNMLGQESHLIEWIFKDFRIGFSIENDEDDSSWFVVANEKFQNLNASGKLIAQESKSIISQIIQFSAVNL